MKLKEMVERVGERYAQTGPMSMRRDARALRAIASELDEAAARVYLDRFVTKWRLFETHGEGASAAPIRRRPMPELEQRVHAALARDTPSTPPDIVIEVSEHLAR